MILAYRRRRLTRTTVREPAAGCRVLPGATAQPAPAHTAGVPCDCSDGRCRPLPRHARGRVVTCDVCDLPVDPDVAHWPHHLDCRRGDGEDCACDLVTHPDCCPGPHP